MQISHQKSDSVTFDDPIGVLKACHQRMLDFCVLLERMVKHQDEHGVDDAMQQSATKIMRYFDTAAKLHHIDEEEDLFPVLAKQADLHSLIQQLSLQHHEHDELWNNLKQCLTKIEIGSDCHSLKSVSSLFADAYRQHIEQENTYLLNKAGNFIDADTLKRMGQAMAKRRRPSSD